MADLLIKLWNVPEKETILSALRDKNIVIRKPIGPEKATVMQWIAERFGAGWVSEAENAFFRSPKSIYIAVREYEKDGMIVGDLLGFACYDATVKGFFGPTGVDEKERGQKIGEALLLSCLHDMREEGYGYCIVGWAGPVDFYKKVCGATVIEDSFPGVYRGLLR